MVSRGDGAPVRADDRLAYGQPDADPFMAVIGMRGCPLAFEDVGELFFIHAVSVIADCKGDILIGFVDDKINGVFAAGMDKGIFQQVDKNLFDQGRIHGQHEKIIRHTDPYTDIRKPFFQPQDCL